MITCNICQKSVDAQRLPIGWKRHEGQVSCSKCWRKSYLMRSISFVVSGPIDGTWEEFRVALKAAWVQSTALANWAVTELRLNDKQRKPEDTKLGTMPKINLYAEANKRYWGWSQWAGACIAAGSLLRGVEAKYRKRRLEVVWRSAASLPTHRYPVPYPIHQQAWQAEILEGVPYVSLPLGGRRWRLKLSTYGAARQLRELRQVLAEDLVGEAAIYRRRSTGQESGVQDRPNGGGQRAQYRVMLKIAVWRPKKIGEREGILKVTTANDCFWRVQCPNRPEWLLNADHIRRRIAQHRIYLQRTSEDTKYSVRCPKRQQLQLKEAIARRCRKQNDRVDWFVHNVTRELALLALRQKVEAVVYDDTVSSYMPSFPWHKCWLLLEQKLEEFGIELRSASGEVMNVEEDLVDGANAEAGSITDQT